MNMRYWYIGAWLGAWSAVPSSVVGTQRWAARRPHAPWVGSRWPHMQLLLCYRSAWKPCTDCQRARPGPTTAGPEHICCVYMYMLPPAHITTPRISSLHSSCHCAEVDRHESGMNNYETLLWVSEYSRPGRHVVGIFSANEEERRKMQTQQNSYARYIHHITCRQLTTFTLYWYRPNLQRIRRPTRWRRQLSYIEWRLCLKLSAQRNETEANSFRTVLNCFVSVLFRRVESFSLPMTDSALCVDQEESGSTAERSTEVLIR